MSRSGYDDGYSDDWWSFIKWRGAVNSAIRGRRGQLFLREMLGALDAMPVKRLVANELAAPDLVTCSHWGLHETESVCAIGAVGKQRGIDMAGIDPDDSGTVADRFGIAPAMAREIVYINDEGGHHEMTPENRFDMVRAWLVNNIKPNEAKVKYNAVGYPL